MKITKLLLLIVIIITSCAEDDVIAISNRTLLAGTTEFGKTWQIQDIKIELGTLTPHPCITDNFITYYPNGRYEVNEGLSKCDPEDPPGVAGTWEFDDFETEIIVRFGDSTQIWTINNLRDENHSISARFIEGKRTYNLSN